MGRKTKAQAEKDRIEKNIRLQFTDWLYAQYEISFLPKYFFINLDKVYKGTYKNLNKPVPVEDLWDMWQKKMPYLQKVHDKNKRCGKEIEGIARISYDLAIILSRYDSYLKWKEEQKLSQTQLNQNEIHIDYDNIKVVKNVSNRDDDKIDIDSILDEI